MAKRKRKRIQKPDQGATYMPSKKVIREACAAIRETWSEKEELKRAGYQIVPHWSVPEVHVNAEEIASEEGFGSDSSGAGGLDASSDAFR